GAAAEELVSRKLRLLDDLATRLGTTSEDLEAKAQAILEDQEKKAQELERLRREMARMEGERLKVSAPAIGGYLLVVSRVSDTALIGELQEYLQRTIPSGVCILAGVSDTNIQLRGTVSTDLAGRGFSAVEELRNLAKRLGGGAGGRPDWAQGGGKDVQGLQRALRETEESLKTRLSQGLQVGPRGEPTSPDK
ncbi:MAG TPA: DHHA1 domain-containing protein, partial [Dehalococcoidia bacterium]|nr:DHHA1 domain-containing protein [Dehalococcoidia bacterium]